MLAAITDVLHLQVLLHCLRCAADAVHVCNTYVLPWWLCDCVNVHARK